MTIGNWAFIDVIRNPEKHKDVFYDPPDGNIEGLKVCVIRDRKPKAKMHFLIIPTFLLQVYKNLNENHISLLEEMRDRAQQLVEELKNTEEGKDMNFKIGFQAIPAMMQIHLHVISDDFQSPHMKNKRHWNAFNTDFFISPDYFISELKKHGFIEVDDAHYNNVIKQPLACPICDREISPLSELMIHLEEFHNKK
eukprot:CAMPEP_0117040920 /NCGR_PEP_ID=MMETSP0472-20121206/28611_1 /TAXON_ID=693140 ORGANISM="Tiarina fusus, Strain LIS" /NCGR_SAMPLE_ID=MMETSP0472 /ASSEMBLY_ACC=CAM_ASM_000603 /LENGTH=194 /DNA_ID=CAMNT_0004751793 /DNA_START=158 /DNA_END=741 /DNA_ORIENTATION=-